MTSIRTACEIRIWADSRTRATWAVGIVLVQCILVCDQRTVTGRNSTGHENISRRPLSSLIKCLRCRDVVYVDFVPRWSFAHALY
jgi:hypothetical protein